MVYVEMKAWAFSASERDILWKFTNKTLKLVWGSHATSIYVFSVHHDITH